MKAIVVPIKEPSNAKTRLASFLSPIERRDLAWAMFVDVANALAETSERCAIFIVTSYHLAAEHARSLGFGVLSESNQSSESSSVDWASATLVARGFDSVLRLPADIPLVHGEDVGTLIATQMSAPGALIVPSRDGTGTNAIMRTPPDLFPSHFGPNSLALHIAEAERAGAAHSIVPSTRIALDIDEPADIEAFFACGAGTETDTFQMLSQINAAERLKVGR
jgi:2-phospho-L-lactate/phosphoenolpyruvate guanylyltransferase